MYLGQLTTPDQPRDAIHIAILAVTAGEELLRGDKLQLKNGLAYFARDAKPLGIVDPFLQQGIVDKGQTFWMLMMPGLRHDWAHPGVDPKPQQPQQPPHISKVEAQAKSSQIRTATIT